MRGQFLKQSFLLLLLILFFRDGYCQLSLLPKALKGYILYNCAICSEKLHGSVHFSGNIKSNSEAYTDYHKCHVFFDKGMIDSSYRYALLALHNLKSHNSTNPIGPITFIEAKILYDRNFLKQSLSEYLKLLRNQSITGELRGYLYVNIGSVYVALEDYSSALPYLLEAISTYQVSDAKTLQIAYNNTGICYLDDKQLDNANLYFTKSINAAKVLNDTVSLAYLYTNIANQYYEQYEDKTATSYFKTALQYALSTNDFQIREIAYKNLSAVYKNKKKYASSLQYLELYNNEHDSLYNRDKVWITAQEKNKLDSELSSKALLLSQQKNQLQSLTLDKQKQQLYIAVFASIAFLCFFGFAFHAYLQKNKQNQIITAQREELDALNHTKDQLFSVVAHDLRSPVQTLRVSLHKLKTSLHHKNISEAEQVAGDVEGIANGTYSLLNNLLYWALSQTGQLHFAKEKLNFFRLTEQVLYDYNSVAAAKNIALENRVPESLYCTGDLNTVKIILRNVTDNAIKFSEPFASIILSGIERQNECILSITNSGKPIEETVVQALNSKNTKRLESNQKQSTGIGLWLVKSMAEQNGGSLTIERQTKGTTVNICLPQYQNHEQAADTYS